MSERSDIQHVEPLLWLLKEIGANGLRLYEHRCTLQGRIAAVGNQNGIENWEFEANIRLPNGEGLFEEIASEATELLAA